MLVFAILTFIFSLALSLAVIVPLTGVLVRFRANYNPKGLQLDSEGVAQPHTGPRVSFLGMFKRVFLFEVRALCLSLDTHLMVSVCRGGLDFTKGSVRNSFTEIPDHN